MQFLTKYYISMVQSFFWIGDVSYIIIIIMWVIFIQVFRISLYLSTALISLFLPHTESLGKQLCGWYRKKLPLKINYSCFGIKQCNGQALVKLWDVSGLLTSSFSYYNFTYSNLLPFFVCNFGNLFFYES